MFIYLNIILKALYPFPYTVYWSCLTIKLDRRNISLFLLQLKKKTFKYAPYALIGYSSSTTLQQIPAFSHENTWPSAEFQSFVQTTREITRTSQNQRKVIFDFPRPLPLDRAALNSSPPPARRGGLVPGFARGNGDTFNWTMHNRDSKKYLEYHIVVAFGRDHNTNHTQQSCFLAHCKWMKI